jgi:hypothetical protein
MKIKRLEKDPFSFPKRRFQLRQKTMGIPKKLKIPKNPFKLQVIQPYPI